MSRKSKDEMERDRRGSSAAGSSAPSRDPNDPRGSRTLGAENTSLKFNQDHFDTKNAEGTSLRIRENRPETRAQFLPIEFPLGGSGPTSGITVIADGIATVFSLTSDSAHLYAKWAFPQDFRESRGAKLHLYWVTRTHGAGGSGGNALDAVINVAPVAVADSMGSFGATELAWTANSGTVGEIHLTTFQLDATLFSNPKDFALFFEVDQTTRPSEVVDTVTVFDSIAILGMSIEYPTRYYHTHERTR